MIPKWKIWCKSYHQQSHIEYFLLFAVISVLDNGTLLLRIFFFSAIFKQTFLSGGGPGWMVNLIEFAVVIEIRNRDNYLNGRKTDSSSYGKNFWACLAFFLVVYRIGWMLQSYSRQNCSPVSVYLYINAFNISEEPSRVHVCCSHLDKKVMQFNILETCKANKETIKKNC